MEQVPNPSSIASFNILFTRIRSFRISHIASSILRMDVYLFFCKLCCNNDVFYL